MRSFLLLAAVGLMGCGDAVGDPDWMRPAERLEAVDDLVDDPVVIRPELMICYDCPDEIGRDMPLHDVTYDEGWAIWQLAQ